MNSFESFIKWAKENKKKSIALGIIVFLIITNPSTRDVEKVHDCKLSDKSQFYIFSIYKCGKYGNEYIGIAGNFFLLKERSMSSNSSVPIGVIDATDY